jgi:hypothetical protein
MRRVGPEPHIRLRTHHEGQRRICGPAGVHQVCPKPLLDHFGPRTAVPFLIDDHHRPPVVGRQRAQQFVGAHVKTGIVLPGGHLDVAAAIKAEGAAADHAMNLIAFEQAGHRFGHVLVGHEEEEVVHSKTLVANRLPRSMPPFHCASRGCSVPGITVAAPDRSSRVMTSSDTCASANTTGEWVETHTCWP